MTRPCAGCGSYECDGIACFMESPDPPTMDELIAVAVHDLEERYGLTESRRDPLKRLEPKRAA